MVVALQGDEVDFVEHFSVAGGQALLDDPNVQVIAISTATHRAAAHAHRQGSVQGQARPPGDRARRSTGKRLVDGLWEGKADLGNDSPFAPLYPSTDTSVPQREQDVEQAKQLLADAGMGDGFEVQLDTWNGFEIPDLAQLVKNYAEKIGVKINLEDHGRRRPTTATASTASRPGSTR